MASSLASLVMLSSGWDKQETHAKLFCSQWPVARVSFFTERTQYQAIWLRMNKNVICAHSSLRACVVLFCSPAIRFQLIQQTQHQRLLGDLSVIPSNSARNSHQILTAEIKKFVVFFLPPPFFFYKLGLVYFLTTRNLSLLSPSKRAQELA